MDQKLVSDFLALIEGVTAKKDLMQEIAFFFSNRTFADAIGIRLKERNDYPYYTTIGFSDGFLNSENSICNGNSLECFCGAVINQNSRTPSYFTDFGSINIKDQTQAVVNEAKANLISPIREKCFQEGYKSIVIIPISFDDKVIGTIQLNNKKPNSFSVDMIEALEKISSAIGNSIGKILKFEEGKKEKKEAFIKHIKEMSMEIKEKLAKFNIEELEEQNVN